MGKKCHDCGKEPIAHQCLACSETLCTSCATSRNREKKEIEKLREGDAYTRLQILCPSCGASMIPF